MNVELLEIHLMVHDQICMMYNTKLEEDYIVRNLTTEKDRIKFGSDGMTYKQMSLFDDNMLSGTVSAQDRYRSAVGMF